MIDITRDIHSLSDFKRRTPDFIKRLEKTRKPVVLTMNGRASVVVQDAESYQRMLEMLERAETIDAIREGLEAVREGDTMSLKSFDERMRRKLKSLRRK